MKKIGLLIAVLLVTFTLTGCDACKDSPLTGIGDSVATLGKDGLEKERVLAERKAKRAGKCAEAKAAEMKKKMGL